MIDAAGVTKKVTIGTTFSATLQQDANEAGDYSDDAAAATVRTMPSSVTSSTDTTSLVDVANSKSIIGTWHANLGTTNAPLQIAITFLSNGTYMMADDSNTTANDRSGQPGIEFGTYTYSNGIVTTACLRIDTDGEWGGCLIPRPISVPVVPDQ